MTETQRHAHLDGLRGLAALMVVIHHTLMSADAALWTGTPALSHWEWDVRVSTWPFLQPAASGNFCVALFFVMSGYVLAGAFERSQLDAAALATKRVLRLGLPIFAVTLMSAALLQIGLMAHRHAAIAITHSPWLVGPPSSRPDWPPVLFDAEGGYLMGNEDLGFSYDPPLWTMPIEFTGSLLLIALVTCGRRAHNRGVLGGACLTLGLVFNAYAVSLLLIGAALHFFEISKLSGRVPGKILTTLTVISLFLGTVPYSSARGSVWNHVVHLAPEWVIIGPWDWLPAFKIMGPEDFWHAIGALLLMTVIEASPRAQTWLRGQLPQFLGGVSFPLYLTHYPLLLSVWCWACVAFHSAGAAYWWAVLGASAVFFPVAIAAARIWLAVVERPSIRLSSFAAQGVQAAIMKIRSRSIA